jgi:hypothetical protein
MTASGTCPGCVGRGTGTHCCMCDRPIPLGLRRQTDVDVPKASCPDCCRGAVHTHR